MKLYIKNMVCNRCIMMVQHEIEKIGLTMKNIILGEVTFEKELSIDEKKTLETSLISLGFEVIDDRKSRNIEKIKNVIIITKPS